MAPMLLHLIFVQIAKHFTTTHVVPNPFYKVNLKIANAHVYNFHHESLSIHQNFVITFL